MTVLRLHAEGQAEVLHGEVLGDLTTLTVLTQASISALSGSMQAVPQAIQVNWGESSVTLFPEDSGSWLWVRHESTQTLEQVRQSVAIWLSHPHPKPLVAIPSHPPVTLADCLNALPP